MPWLRSSHHLCDPSLSPNVLSWGGARPSTLGQSVKTAGKGAYRYYLELQGLHIVGKRVRTTGQT